jgi:hypothetical protein
MHRALRRTGEHVSQRREELSEVRRLEVALQAVEAVPHFDEDKAVQGVDVLVHLEG